MYRTPDPVSTPLIPVFFLLPLTFSLCFSGGSQRLIQPCSFSVNSVVVCIEKARARLNVTALILGFQHGDLLKVTSLKYLHGTGPIHHLTIFSTNPRADFVSRHHLQCALICSHMPGRESTWEVTDTKETRNTKRTQQRVSCFSPHWCSPKLKPISFRICSVARHTPSHKLSPILSSGTTFPFSLFIFSFISFIPHLVRRESPPTTHKPRKCGVWVSSQSGSADSVTTTSPWQCPPPPCVQRWDIQTTCVCMVLVCVNTATPGENNNNNWNLGMLQRLHPFLWTPPSKRLQRRHT